MPTHEPEITLLLQRWTAGDEQALHRLVPLLYEPLRQLAHYRLQGERDGHSLNTTGLVHEAYLKLVGGAAPAVRDRQHFLAVASRVMRHVLVDHARARTSRKRGGGAPAGLLQSDWTAGVDLDAVMELDRALKKLETLEPRQSSILEQHYFGGLTLEETAGALEISVRTVKRDLRAARAWLAAELGPAGAS